MSTRTRSIGATLLGGVALVAVTVAGPVAGASTPTAAAGPKTTISVGDNFFKPKTVTITEGTTVVWKNKGKVLHAVRPDKGKAFGTSSLRRGSAYKYTFKTAGSYGYYCPIHSSAGGAQAGTIVVKPAPPAPTTPTT